MSIFLHIGYPKTATSWLQQKIFLSHPKIDLWRGGPQYEWTNEIIRLNDFDFDPDYFQEKHLVNIQIKADKAIVISEEGYAGDPFTGARDSHRNADRLHAIFPNAKIIICIRNQLDMIDSLYRQYIHEGGAGSLKSFLSRQFPSRVRFCLDFLKYNRIVGYYQALFGVEAVYLCLYEELSNSPQVFLDRLFSFMGLCTPPISEDVIHEKVNRGMSNFSVGIASFVNRFVLSGFNPVPVLPSCLGSAATVRRLLQRRLDPHIFNSLSSRRRLIEPKMESHVENYFRQSNRELMSVYSLPLERYGYPL